MPVPRMEEALKALRPSLGARADGPRRGQRQGGSLCPAGRDPGGRDPPCGHPSSVRPSEPGPGGASPARGPVSQLRGTPGPRRRPGPGSRAWTARSWNRIPRPTIATWPRPMSWPSSWPRGSWTWGWATTCPSLPPPSRGSSTPWRRCAPTRGISSPPSSGRTPSLPRPGSRLVEALAAIHRRLAEESGGEEFIPMAVPDLRERSPELREVRDLIDDVDRELLELLHRRTQLAQRAARAKAELGAPILDPARESHPAPGPSSLGRGPGAGREPGGGSLPGLAARVPAGPGGAARRGIHSG